MGAMMDDYLVVVNAGSSSLKFCVYRATGADAWPMDARGQIEGIGTSPRFSARDGAGTSIGDERPGDTVRDTISALDFLA